MSMKDKLQIYLITYNRKKHLQMTLESIFADNSPIRDFDITILDNASTDGTSELIEEYCQKFPNVTHIKHKINIGGNANICRAFEMGATSGKEYFWVLCDDDKYDFSNWHELEIAMEQKKDIICVADYIFPSNKDKKNFAYIIPQLTFVPAGIFRSDLITDNVLTCMYDSIYTMFQQLCPTIFAINNNKAIHVLEKPIVFNGLHFEDSSDDVSYTRGSSNDFLLERRKATNWILGFSNIISLLNDTNVRTQTFEQAILYKDIYNTFDNFQYSISNIYLNTKYFSYFIEVFRRLSFARKLQFICISPITCIIYFYRGKNGIYVRLFNCFKTKIIPLKSKSQQ